MLSAMHREKLTDSIIFLLTALLFLVAPLRADVVEPGKLKIASMNVENFFDVFDNPYTEDEVTRIKPRDEVLKLARAIRAINADVIALQEVENEHVLKAIVAEQLADMGYEYIVTSPSNDGRGIRLGVISRVPIDRTVSYRERKLRLPGETNTWEFARDLFEVRLRIGDDEHVDLFVVHFKSKRDSDGDPKSAKWRLAEAKEARRIIDAKFAANPDALYMIAGDFNDTPRTQTVDALLESKGDQPKTLIDLHAQMPDSKRITYLREPYRDRGPIDYMFASPALTKRVVEDSATVVDDPNLLESSDHAPLLATIVTE